jgi:hypothetical protein
VVQATVGQGDELSGRSNREQLATPFPRQPHRGKPINPT